MPEQGAASTSDNGTAANNQSQPALSKDDIIATVVNQALDGNDAPLNEMTDKVLRAKSKS